MGRCGYPWDERARLPSGRRPSVGNPLAGCSSQCPDCAPSSDARAQTDASSGCRAAGVTFSAGAPTVAPATAHKPDPCCDKVLFDLCFFYEDKRSPGGFLNGPPFGLAQLFDTLANPVFHSVDEGVDQRTAILRGASVLAAATIVIDLGEDGIADQVEQVGGDLGVRRQPEERYSLLAVEPVLAVTKGGNVAG